MKWLRGNVAATILCTALLMPVKAASGAERIRVYQLFVRLFSNTNETRKPNGTLAENGVGKFDDINDAALSSLRKMGFTHLWLTGVLQQATGTDYSKAGQAADDPDLLKGIAGSPYAIKDYFDVCPDYAVDPARRLEEFKALIARIHQRNLRVLIDFVPNHAARCYHSDIKPEFDFGAKGQNGKGDDTSKFFDPQNNFYYLRPGAGGPRLRLPSTKNGQPVSPTCSAIATLSEPSASKDEGGGELQKCDGLFEPEKEHGRVTGNNKINWQPNINDWYETVKLNYGFDFTAANKDVREYPTELHPEKPVPDTWNKMDRVLEYWQSFGVDGFRCDMAHMEPPEFWQWAIARARGRNKEVVFIAEAYDNDPNKVPATDSKLRASSNVLSVLLKAGFDAVYDDPTYRAIKKIYDGPGWANDIDTARPDDLIFEGSLRYAENHDEVRLAAKSQWGGVGMKAGPAISTILYGLSRGPVMLYNGQEVGEPAAGAEGFGSDDARTSIFDYWSMPELVKWVNDHKYDGGKLSDQQKELRTRYSNLLHTIGKPGFSDGNFIPLNPGNRDNPGFGRFSGEKVSGHWLYSFARVDPASHNTFVVAVNLNPVEIMRDVKILLPESLQNITPSIEPQDGTVNLPNDLEPNHSQAPGRFAHGSVIIGALPPLTAVVFELKRSD